MPDLGLNIAKTNDAAELELVYEDSGQPMGICLTLGGPDSETYRAAERRNHDARLERLRKNQPITAEVAENWQLDLLVACTLGWRFAPPAVRAGETGPEFTPLNLRALYEVYPEISEQVNRFIGQRRNFRAPMHP